MSRSQRRTFAEVYYSLTGQSIEDLVARYSRSEGQDIDEDEEEFQFNEEFVGPRKETDFEHKISPPQEEKLKGLYRKLIRKLHPDLQASTPAKDQSAWIKRVWNLVQKAYSSKDVSSLERLLSLTLLRLNDLNQLTLDEIQQAKRWLQKDLGNLEQEARHLKKSMAWGFSAKKDYSGLTRKIKKEFEESVATVRYQIEEIEREHRVLQMLFNMEGSEHRSQPKRKKHKVKTSRRRRNTRRRFPDDDNQESFSF